MTTPPIVIRPFTLDDLPWLTELTAQPGAAPWTPTPGEWGVLCPPHAFLHFREVAPREFEILNLVVGAPYRRRGLGRALLAYALEREGDWFLEVRESNHPARQLYEKAGFAVVGRRQKYYQNPPEDGIVMALKRC